MLAIPRHFITSNDVTGNTTQAELFVVLHLTSLHFSILFWLELQGTLQYA